MKKVFAFMLIYWLLPINIFATQYHLVSIEKLAEQEIGRIIMPQVYQRAGLDVTITPMPGKRAQAEVISGRKDGEIMRIWHYGTENPTTIRVPTPYYFLETMAFIRKDSGITITSKADLAKYRLVKIRGVKHTNYITAGMLNVYDIESTEAMFKLLQNNRADVALTNTLDGQLLLSKLGLDTITAIKKPLAVLPLYHYLHRNNADLVSKIDAALKAMIDSGELKTLIDKAKQQVIRQRAVPAQ